MIIAFYGCAHPIEEVIDDSCWGKGKGIIDGDTISLRGLTLYFKKDGAFIYARSDTEGSFSDWAVTPLGWWHEKHLLQGSGIEIAYLKILKGELMWVRIENIFRMPQNLDTIYFSKLY